MGLGSFKVLEYLITCQSLTHVAIRYKDLPMSTVILTSLVSFTYSARYNLQRGGGGK